MNAALGATPINDLAAGIWEALLTTAGGLSVAIPAYIAHNFLVVRLNSIVTDMERAGIEVVQMLKTPAPAPVPSPAPAPASPPKPSAPSQPAPEAQGAAPGGKP
jgi:biopolymer transport protein ExbB